MTPENAAFTVALAQTDRNEWAWRVLRADGRDAAVGKTLREDVARGEAEFFKRFLEKRSNRW